MGDRGNIVLRYKTQSTFSDIYLYTHWGGSELGIIVQNALTRGSEYWDDPLYMGRIIFNEMTLGEEVKTTGFGISPYIGDNEHALLIVHLDDNLVGWSISDSPNDVNDWQSYSEFVKSPRPEPLEQEDEEDEDV